MVLIVGDAGLKPAIPRADFVDIPPGTFSDGIKSGNPDEATRSACNNYEGF